MLIAGRPVGSPPFTLRPRRADGLAARRAGWPGIVDVLTGVASPGGKLPISYPRSSGQIPIFYGHKVSGGRSHWKGSYVDESNEPLYPFGHGLGYSTFTIVAEGVSRPRSLSTTRWRSAPSDEHRRSKCGRGGAVARDPMASIRARCGTVGFAGSRLRPVPRPVSPSGPCCVARVLRT